MISVLSSLAASLVLFGFMLDWIWKKVTSKYANIAVKGLTVFPLLGHLPYIPREPKDFFHEALRWIAENDFVTAIWLGPLPVVLTARQEHAEAILKDSKIISKSYFYKFLHPWLNTGLLTSDGSKWKERRKLLTPTFHFGILHGFAEIFKAQADVLVEKLMGSAERGEIIEICQPVSLCALDIICETAMGVRVGAQSGEHDDYIEAIKELSKLIQMRQRSPWVWPELMYATTPSGQQHNVYVDALQTFTTKVINERMKSRKSAEPDMNTDGTRKKLAFLDLLLDGYERGQIDIDGIKEEVDTFMFEGHDTTSHGISWAMYLLGRNPEIQKKVHEEVDSLFVEDWSKLSEATKGMDLLGRVIKESLRLYPPVPIIGRGVEDEDFDFGNSLQIYKGSNILLCIYALHRNKEIWENPEKFDPDRFFPENCVKRHPFAYVPFSAGPRNCIGQKFAQLEEKIVLAKFLRHYEIHSLDAEEDLNICGEVITRAENGIRIQLKPRHVGSKTN